MMKSIVIAHGSGYGSITASAADLRLPYSDCPNRAAKSPHGLLSSTPDASSAANVGRNSQCQPTREELPTSGQPLALIGNASAQKFPGRRAGPEAFSIRPHAPLARHQA